MEIKIEGKFIEELRKILEYPPYLIFVFVGAIFVCISLIKGNYFDQVWIFLIYSVIGSIWRYIEKDILSGIQKLIETESNKNISNLIVISLYHIGNIALLVGLFYYLNI